MRRHFSVFSIFSLLLIAGSAYPARAPQGSSSGDQFNASSAYAGMDPLEGTRSASPVPTSGPCVPPPNSNWQMVGRDNINCYWYVPYAQRLNGYVTSSGNVPAVERLGGTCSTDAFNPNDAVCQNAGDNLPGARSTTGLPASIGGGNNSSGGNPTGGSSGGNGGNGGNRNGQPTNTNRFGQPGGGYTAPTPGPNGAANFGHPSSPDATPCQPLGRGGYDYCANGPGALSEMSDADAQGKEPPFSPLLQHIVAVLETGGADLSVINPEMDALSVMDALEQARQNVAKAAAAQAANKAAGAGGPLFGPGL